MKKTIAVALVLFATASVVAQTAGEPYLPTDAERARWTLQDMRSWKIALDAYRMDHHAYPSGSTLQEAASAVEGKYIQRVAMHDAWGRPYLYERTESGFLLVSAGADGKFDRATWTSAAQLDSLDGDAVISDQAKFWLRSWRFR